MHPSFSSISWIGRCKRPKEGRDLAKVTIVEGELRVIRIQVYWREKAGRDQCSNSLGN